MENKGKYCINCKKKITLYAKRCRSCSKKGNKAPRFIDGRSLQKHYCINCKKEVSTYKTKKCQKCYLKTNKDKKNSNYKGGKPKCIDCNRKLKHYGNNRCRKCYKKFVKIPENNPNFGNHINMSSEWREKQQLLNWQSGKNSHNWQGGKSFEPYPLGWTNTFKEQIRYKDGYKCQVCGCHEVECSRKLDVHHIDYDKENINLNNLISLCKSCHTKTNFNRKYWEGYFKCKNKVK